MEFNNIQTSLDKAKEMFEHYTWRKEAYGDLVEFIDTIPFLRTISSNNRPFARTLERDSDGRAIIDITNPPILEDMDFFRKPALEFIRTGKYTQLYKNGNPNSEYMKFWTSEEYKCEHGLVRESDGMWITGYNYWYWNYSPIMLTKDIGKVNKDGSVRAERIYTHPAPWDHDVTYFHYLDQAAESGNHAAIIKARGKGYSYKAGSMLTRNLMMLKNTVSFAFAAMDEYLLGGDGLLTKAWDTADFVNVNTPFKKHFSPNKADEKRSAYYDMDDAAYKGYKSIVRGVIVNKPSKTRGKRSKIALFEEAGSFPNLLKAWNIYRSSIEDGGSVFGQAIAFGTGGDENSDNLSSLDEMFYYPRGYKIHALSNIYDKNASNSDCAFFVPTYMNRKNCYDNNGNSDVVKAMAEVIIGRLTVKYGASDSNALTQTKAEHPVTPVDALMRIGTSVFPVADIKDYLTEILPNQESFVSDHYVGDLHFSGDKSVSWRLNADRVALRTYPIKESDQSGAVEIYELPKKGLDNKPANDRYIIGVDPVDADTGTSLFSAFVFDLWTDKFVAEFTGRRKTANENFEIVLRMSLFYNAQINYENNLKGLFSYFDNRNFAYLLMDTPAILKDQEMIRSIGYGNKAKGTPANKAVNLWARKLLADYMLERHEEASSEEVMTVDGNNFEKANAPTIKLTTIRSLGLLREASQWNPDGNFDRVSSAGMVMIARAELYKHTERNKFNERIEDPLENDEFLNNNDGNYGTFELI